MASTWKAISGKRTMLEQFREMENSLREIAGRIRRACQILSMSGSSTPGTYLSAIRAVRALQEAWSVHLEIERVLFPRILRRNLLSSDFLKRIMERDQATDKQLEAILSAPWPRSPQSGLQSLRVGLRPILSQVRIQIEAEQALILAAIPRIDRGMPTLERVESEPSELVAI